MTNPLAPVISVIDELNGVSYVICKNASSTAKVVQIDIRNQYIGVSATLTLTPVQIGQYTQIVGLAKGRSQSLLLVVLFDSSDNPLTLYIVNASLNTPRLSLGASWDLSQNSVVQVLGGDLQNVYTLDYDGTSNFVSRRDVQTGRLLAKSNRFSGQYVDAMIDTSLGVLVLWTQAGITQYSIPSLSQKTTCTRIPTFNNCSNWYIFSHGISQDAFWGVKCQETREVMVIRASLSDRTSCTIQCGIHGQCVNSKCLCFDGYSGSDCTNAGNGCGMVCNQDSDCWVNPPWNSCPVCYKKNSASQKTCQPVCTAPCTSTQQCANWASHSVLNQMCAKCNLQFQYCCAGC
jgi:hypothetical protein